MPENTWTQVAPLVTTKTGTRNTAIQDEVVSLFTELRAPLLRYLNLNGLPIGDGEDVLQETFLALFLHLLAGKPRDNLHGWIFRVARNIALKRLQHDKSSMPVPDSLPLANSTPNPEERAVRLQQDQAIRAVVARLPDLDRHCLCLRAEGLRYRDIAKALDISLGSVALALSRTLAKLARAVQK